MIINNIYSITGLKILIILGIGFPFNLRNTYSQDSIKSIHFTRYCNDNQLILKLTRDTCYFSDNIGRTDYKDQKTLTINEYRDWNQFLENCGKFIVKCKPVSELPDIKRKTSIDTIYSELYIETENKIYSYRWFFYDEKLKSNFQINDYFDNCFSDEVLLCEIYNRLIK